MKILTTGANGFVGRNLIKHLVGKRIYDVVTLSRKSIDFEQDGIEVVYGDLSEKNLLTGHFDVLVHTAAQSPAVGVSMEQYIYSNVIAIQRIVDFARSGGVGKIINLSSISLYGDIGEQVLEESAPIINPNPYGITKLLGEMLLKELKELPSVSLRLPGVLGRGNDRIFLSSLAASLIRNEPVTVYNPKSLFNNIVYIDNLVDFIESLFSSQWQGPDFINLASTEPLCMMDVVSTLSSLFRSHSPVFVEETTKTSFSISIEKACRDYQYRPLSTMQSLELYACSMLE